MFLLIIRTNCKRERLGNGHEYRSTFKLTLFFFQRHCWVFYYKINPFHRIILPDNTGLVKNPVWFLSYRSQIGWSKVSWLKH